MRERVWSAAVVGSLVLLTFAGCWKKSGEAVVIAKAYVPASAASETPTASPANGQVPSPTDEATPKNSANDDSTAPPVDPRATSSEQWIVSVQMIADLRRIDVRVEQPQWNALKEGDRVQIAYRQGKYTGTVWSAEIK